MSDYIRKSELIKELEKIHPRVNGIDVFWSVMKVVENQPTVDEKEIIRKAFERVVKRICDVRNNTPSTDFKNGCNACLVEIHRDIDEIVKEECGISE